MDQYAVIGHPISHSKSPLIHQLFAAQTGQLLNYERYDVTEEKFESFVLAFFARSDGKGLNVTVPHKERAWALVQQHTARAAMAGAVNTLYLEQGRLVGDNTDGPGLVRDLMENHHVVLREARILVLGAGGAVRGVLQPLLQQRPQSLVIANRTLSKAQTLAGLFAKEGLVEATSFADLQGEYDLIINGTSASLQGALPPLPRDLLAPNCAVYDMMYGSEPTPFLQWAVAAGVTRGFDGLGMLVEQAAEAFAVWRGVRPETAPVIRQLRA